MLKNLHMRLVLVLVMLVVSVMAVVGTFMLSSVIENSIREFTYEMSRTFTQEFILTLQHRAEQPPGGAEALRDWIGLHSGALGIDEHRLFFILDGTGTYLAGSNDAAGAQLARTPNIITAMGGQVGQQVTRMGSYFDIAIPITTETQTYIVGVIDDRNDLSALVTSMIDLLIRAMLFGVAASVILSIPLSKTITTPVERLTRQAAAIAAGDFSAMTAVQSTDEIGVLTRTFNDMARVLETTLGEVEDERSKLDTLFQHMADGVVAFGRNGKIQHRNRAAELMLGQTLDGAQAFESVFPNLHVDGELLRDGGTYLEIDYAANMRTLKVLLAPLTLGGEESGLIAVLHDVTEQRKLDESRREFIANVSHELRTPLTNIKGYAETLADAIDELDADVRRQFIGVIESEAERMTRIVKDLLTLSQFDYGRMTFQFSSVSLSAVAAATIQAMDMEAKSRQVTLISKIPPELPCIEADRERIEQVFINILSNAIKYNRPLGRVTLIGGRKGDNVFVRFEDTGVGVPEGDIPRIFERFYRVDKARSRERGGTGLGLAIARQIIHGHGGSVAFESTYDVGSCVTVTLPIAPPDAQEEAGHD